MLSGKSKFEGDGYKLAADKVVELYKAGAFGKNPLEADNPTSNTMLTDGKAAMSFMGSWLTPNFYDTKISKVNPDDIQALAIPMIAGGKGTDKEYCGGFVEAFFVNKATKVPDEAVKFANYINQTMGKLSYENGLAFSAYNDTFDESKVSPLFKQIKEVFSNCTSNVLAWDTSLPPEAATVTNEQAQSLLTDGVDTNEFMKANQDAINK
jgi:raffinose/stachyose/melibiose transport system substrate-binding protein